MADNGDSTPGETRTLSVDELAELLHVPVTVIQRHIESGAPSDPDGSMDFAHYAAWVAKQVIHGP